MVAWNIVNRMPGKGNSVGCAGFNGGVGIFAIITGMEELSPEEVADLIGRDVDLPAVGAFQMVNKVIHIFGGHHKTIGSTNGNVWNQQNKYKDC